MKARIIFAGSGEFGLPALMALRAAGHELALVISQPDRHAGRGRQLAPTPIAQYALTEKLPLLRTADINSEALLSADVMVVIAFGQKISPAVAGAPRLGSMNLHSSLLPKCRGAAPINWTIIRGETTTGNSIIRLADKMDAGNLLAQSSLPVGELETAGELHDRLATDGAGLVVETVCRLLNGTATETPQDHSQATIAPKLSRQHTLLDFAGKSAAELSLQIRGLYPWPGCRVRILDEAGQPEARVTLVRVRPASAGSATLQPGQITGEGTICVGPDHQAIEVLELQPEGRGVMTLNAYRNGHRWLGGMRLESVLS